MISARYYIKYTITVRSFFPFLGSRGLLCDTTRAKITELFASTFAARTINVRIVRISLDLSCRNQIRGVILCRGIRRISLENRERRIKIGRLDIKFFEDKRMLRNEISARATTLEIMSFAVIIKICFKPSRERI